MAVFTSGADSSILANVGAAAASGIHVIPKPVDYSVGGNPVYGHYQVCVQTGAIGAGLASNSELLQFYWSDTTRLAIIQRVWLTGMRATTAFAVGSIDLKMTVATSWTAAGSGGGTVTLTDPEAELRTGQMGASLVGEIRLATTAALGVGTKTLNTNDVGQIVTHSSAGTGSAGPIIGSIYLPLYDLFDDRGGSAGHPLVFAQNEGFVIRATVPATGVWNLGIGVRWAEAQYF